MLDTYKIIIPDPERAKAYGANLMGMVSRTLNFLNGTAFGLNAVESAVVFHVDNVKRNVITVRTDSKPLIDSIATYMATSGVIVKKA